MRKVVFMLVLLVAMLSLTSVQVSAHTLQWGVMPESQFEFTAHGEREDIGIVDLDYSLTITALESIPATFEYANDFPRTTVSLKDLDDNSNLDMGNDISTLCFGSYSAMPLGDWDYLSQVIEDYSVYHDVDWFREMTTFENTTHWGFSEHSEHSSARIYKTTIHLKENGIMVYFSGSHWSYTEQIMMEDVTIKQIVDSTTPTTTTTTTTSTTTTSTTTSTTTTDTAGSGTTLAISPELGFVLILFIGIIGIAAFVKRGKTPSPGETPLPISPDVKVLIVCPYCGARNEQGILKCQTCQADI